MSVETFNKMYGHQIDDTSEGVTVVHSYDGMYITYDTIEKTYNVVVGNQDWSVSNLSDAEAILWTEWAKDEWEGITTQWYEVVRKDGTKQYATKTEGGYLLYGSGFVITKLDAVSVTPIDSVPTNLKQGFVYLDSSEEGLYKAICDTNDRWNGWAKPYISEDDIERLCELISDEQFITYRYEKDNNRVVVVDNEGYEEDHYIESEELEGQTWYYLGGEGLIFDFEPMPFNRYGNVVGYHSPHRSLQNFNKIQELVGADIQWEDASWHNDTVDSMVASVCKGEGYDLKLHIYLPNSDNNNPCEEEFSGFQVMVLDEVSGEEIWRGDCDTLERLESFLENAMDGFRNVEGVLEAQMHLLYGAVLGEFGATRGDETPSQRESFDKVFATVLLKAVEHALNNIQ